MDFRAQGDVPDEDPGVGTPPTGSTFSTEAYTYTASISGLPLQEPFDGSFASFVNPANSDLSRYVAVRNVTFHYDDPQSDTKGCGSLQAVQKVGVPTVVNDGAEQLVSIGPGMGLDFQGAAINVPVSLVSWPASPIEAPPGCVTNPGDVAFNGEAKQDSVETSRDRHTTTEWVNLGRWGFADINGIADNDGGDEIGQLFLGAPKVRCVSAIPRSYTTSGSCTITNHQADARAVLSASIHWSFKASNVPHFTDRIVAGDHQTAKRRQLFDEPLIIKVVKENGKPVPNGVGVYCKHTTGPPIMFVSSSSTITERGQVDLDLKAGPRPGKVTINCAADGVTKSLTFHLKITR